MWWWWWWWWEGGQGAVARSLLCAEHLHRHTPGLYMEASDEARRDICSGHVIRNEAREERVGGACRGGAKASPHRMHATEQDRVTQRKVDLGRACSST